MENDDQSTTSSVPTLNESRLNEFNKNTAIEYGDTSGDSVATPDTGDTSSVTDSSKGSLVTASDLESQDEFEPYVPPKGSEHLIQLYFRAWNVATILLFFINMANMNWVYLFSTEPWWMITLSIFFFCIQGILQWSVLELPLMSFVSIFVKAEKDRAADGRHLSVIINYNLLASYHSEVDTTMTNAFQAYTDNLGPSVVSVLVSATGDEELKAYELQVRDNFREQIVELVLTEGTEWANCNPHGYDPGRALRMFKTFRDKETGHAVDGFVESILPALAKKYAEDFMVVHRVTRGK